MIMDYIKQKILKSNQGNQHEDARQLLLCMQCLRPLYPTNQPITLLQCQHVIHTACLKDYASTRGREVIKETVKECDFGIKRLGKLDCPICNDTTQLPVTGSIEDLPKTYHKKHFIHDVESKLILQYKPRSLLEKQISKSSVPVFHQTEYYDDPGYVDDSGAPESDFSPSSDHGPLSDEIIRENTNYPFTQKVMQWPDLQDHLYNISRDDASCEDNNAPTNGNMSSLSLGLTSGNNNASSYTAQAQNGLDSRWHIPEPVLNLENSLYNSSSQSDDSGYKTNLNAVKHTQTTKKNSGAQSDELQTSSNQSNQDAKCAQICCREHKKSPCMLFCESCSIPICDKCSFKEHKGHIIEDLILMTENWKKELEKFKVEMMKSLQDQRQWENQIVNLKKQQNQTYKEMRELVMRHTHQLQQEIEHRRDRFLKVLQYHCRAQDENYKRASKVIKYNIDCSDNLHELMTSVSSDLKNGEARLLINYKTLGWRVTNHMKEVKYGKEYVDKLRDKLVFHQKDERGKVVLGTLEKDKYDLITESTQKQSISKPGYSGNRQLSQIHTSPQIIWDFMEPPTALKDYNEITSKTNLNPKGILFLQDNSLLVTFNGINDISRFRGINRQNKGVVDQDFRLRDGDSKEGVRKMMDEKLMPGCITMLGKDKFAVTDSRRMTIRIFDTTGLQIHKMKDEFLRQQKKITEDENKRYSATNPIGIAKLRDNKIAVSDNIHNTVYIIDINREVVVTKFGETGNGKLQFDSPDYLTYDKTYNRIIVSDRKNHIIKVFDTDGKWINEFGHQDSYPNPVRYDDDTQTNEFHGFNQPAGVVCDYQGNILVANGYYHNICRFNSEGKFVSVVDVYKDNRKVMLSWPTAIDLGPEGQLALTEKTTGRVSVVQAYY